jgi:hypothetical protein
MDIITKILKKIYFNKDNKNKKYAKIYPEINIKPNCFQNNQNRFY